MKGPDFRPMVEGPIDGNAFAIMGVVSRALRRAGADREYINLYMEEAMCKSYDNLLKVSMEHVDFDL